MVPEDHPVEYILDAIDGIMAPVSQPTVLLFDIGGVCVSEIMPTIFTRNQLTNAQVVSPFQSILDYELSLNIPPGWVNYSISKTAPDGFWHRLETGKIKMDKVFFAGFNADLHDPVRWEALDRKSVV